VVLTKQFRQFVWLVAAAGWSIHPADGHDVVTTKLTWGKEVSRVVFQRCASCHRPEGKAFSLLTYAEARPWAKAMQEEVLRRRMPPWNAVKGFGEFRHDLGLSEEEIHLLADWVEGGAPEGDANLLPPTPRAPKATPGIGKGTKLAFAHGMKLARRLEVRALELGQLAEGTSFKLLAELPDGSLLPLLWIEGFSSQATRLYEFAQAQILPAGSKLLAYPSAGVLLDLLAAPTTNSSRQR
jgi:mono/diheme cytochrome c family protein